MKKVKFYDKLHGLCANYNSKCDYLAFLDEALRKIERQFYESNGDYKKQHLERVFCYELYYQLKTLMSTDFEYHTSGLLISGEIGKRTTTEENQIFLIEHDDFKVGYIYPDLVIHKSQEDRSLHNQKLIIEAKYNNYNKKPIVKDLTKLINALEYLHYQCAVFLSIKTCAETLIGLIQKYLSEVNINNNHIMGLSKRLIIVNISSRVNEFPIIEAVSLYDILQAR